MTVCREGENRTGYGKAEAAERRGTPAMALIEIRNLKYKYPGTEKLALRDVSLQIEKGEFIGIAGANGAGKSTLSQAMLGLVPQFYKGAYGGQVWIDGQDAKTTAVEELCRKVGLVFQNPFNQLSGAKNTVYDEVGFGLQNLGVAPEEIRRRIEEVLRRFGIWEFRDRNPFDLSGGQLQRVAIASVLAMNPEILILDEPTSQLDPVGAEEVFHTVDQLTEMGITIIMIEQKIEKLADYCDKIALMQEGTLVAYDTPEKIFSRDDLAEYGVQPPVYTEFARKLGLRQPDGTYPVTRKEMLEAVQRLPVHGTASELTREKVLQALREEIRNTGNHADSAGNSVSEAGTRKSFSVQDLYFSYGGGELLFQGLQAEFDFRPTAIVGQNGAGKTTLVRILKGLLKPESGRILYGQEDLAGKTVAELAGRVGYVFQNPDDQIFKYNVLEEVMFGPLNIGMSRGEAEMRAKEALQIVGLQETAGENPYDLELSDRKLVAIASVLAMNPEVIILDEPTIAQDAEGKEKIRKIIDEQAAQGKLVIAILHDMDFVARSFSRVIVMAHGEILTEGTPDQVFRAREELEKAALMPPYLIALLDDLEAM